MDLLIGCGSSREKRMRTPYGPDWEHLVTVDLEPSHHPDYVHDLNQVPYPFETSSVREIHAYEVLEHLGRQGDYVGFFELFNELWRILEPGGYLCATCPSWQSMWAWGDPGHTRVISSGSLVFLDQTEYTKQVGVTSMSDYRAWYWGDFKLYAIHETNQALQFIMQAVKPARRG